MGIVFFFVWVLEVWIFVGTRCLLVMDFAGAVRWMKPSLILFFWSAIESWSVFWLAVVFIFISGTGYAVGAVCLLEPDYEPYVLAVFTLYIFKLPKLKSDDLFLCHLFGFRTH